MKYLYRLYQLVICLPILLVASVLTSLSTVLGPHPPPACKGGGT